MDETFKKQLDWEMRPAECEFRTWAKILEIRKKYDKLRDDIEREMFKEIFALLLNEGLLKK